MKKILFLEGNIQSGKSTTILNNIKHLSKSDLGGFFCQRLTKEGETKAFRLVSAGSTETLTLKYNSDLSDIFLEEVFGKWIKNEGVFLTKGFECLSCMVSKKLIILDEIGGFELFSDEFTVKIFEILKGDVPVLGVIKSNNNGMIMKKTIGLNNEYWTRYEKLRCYIETLGGKILNINKINISDVDNEVKNFLKISHLT